MVGFICGVAVSRRAVIGVGKALAFVLVACWIAACATGGGATDLLLDAYEATDRVASIRDRRFTVTHGNFPNAAAIARYRKAGYALFGRHAAYYADRGHALRFEKRLMARAR